MKDQRLKKDVGIEYGLLYKFSMRRLPSYKEVKEEAARLEMELPEGVKKVRSLMARQMVQDTREVVERVLGLKLSERRA